MKVAGQPWLNDVNWAFRQECQKAGESRKKIGYRFHLIFLKSSLFNYQTAVKKAKSNFFSQFISDSAKRPKVLFDMIDSFLNPTPNFLSFVRI